MAARILVLSFFFAAATLYISKVSKSEPASTLAPLAGLPLQVADWQGRDVSMDDKVVSVLGVDDYLNREYVLNGRSVGLYVGFYQTQRQGNTIHSPLNCLPGAGWDPVSRSYISLPTLSDSSLSNRGIQINRITVEKGLNRAIVLYWYQAHGRIVASEYWGRLYTVLDAMRINRTDGAIVRVVTNIAGAEKEAEAAAENDSINFVKSIYPLLWRYLPE